MKTLFVFCFQKIVEPYGPLRGSNWPRIGCGANFKAYVGGPSRVRQVHMPDGKWGQFPLRGCPRSGMTLPKGATFHWINAMAQLGLEQLYESSLCLSHGKPPCRVHLASPGFQLMRGEPRGSDILWEELDQGG